MNLQFAGEELDWMILQFQDRDGIRLSYNFGIAIGLDEVTISGSVWDWMKLQILNRVGIG